MLRFVLLLISLKAFADMSFFYNRNLKEPILQLKENEEIVIFAPCRTGSTLLYNILNYLCEDQFWDIGCMSVKRVKRLHVTPTFKKGIKYYVFMTIRNPFEAIQSFCNCHGIRRRHLAQEKIKLIDEQFLQVSHLFQKKTDFECKTLLRYEDFENELSYLIDQIEISLKRKIPEEAKKYIFKQFNRFSMKQIADMLGPWRNFHKVMALRGGHVRKPRNKYVQSKSFNKLCVDELTKTAVIWGY
ncbi:MAG: hypothetical protein S4CHLAM20_13320 [Chlamydiia bacterium]|nr:hypothetical protein [Chlamydiia bacterium]